MTIKKNWFYYFSLAVFEVFAVYALFSSIMHLADSNTYPFLWYGGISAIVIALVHILSNVCARLKIAHTLSDKKRQGIERIIVAVVLILGTVVRIWVINKLPIAPSSDYQTYFQVADLLSQGILNSSGYSGYIAQFPHVIGYPFILSLLFRVTGPSVAAGIYLNLAASLISVYLTYRITRTLCGRMGGMIALFAAAFWPSQILYGTLLGSESVFTCLLLLLISLFIYFFRYPVSLGNREGAIFLCAILGIFIGLVNAIRPMAMIFLIAVILCIAPYVVNFNRNEKMLNSTLTRASCQGWFIALVIFTGFFICNQLLSSSISNTIAYKLPGSSVSFGYNLMVGVNIEADGAWNQQDADFFANEFTSTNSPHSAHEACIDVALQRIKNDPVGVSNLALKKFTLLWKNDDYGKTWTELFLTQQGNMTPERQNIINRFTQWNNFFYLFSILFSSVFGIQMLKKKDPGPEHALILLFVGTVILHMVLECQNRYHYFILPVFMILASMGIVGIYRSYTRSPNESCRNSNMK